MRKTIAAIAIAAILLGAFTFALFVPATEAVVAQEVESEDLETTVPESIEDVLADLVEDGVITEEQGAQVAEALRERVRDFWGHRHAFKVGASLETVAGVIGIEVDALRDAVRDGQSIAEVAEANGSSAQAVIEALVAEMNTRVDQAVEDGKLTEERADEIRAEAPDKIESMVNGEFEGRRGPGGHHRGFGGPDSALDDETGAEETSL
jgi:hypothetical protein